MGEKRGDIGSTDDILVDEVEVDLLDEVEVDLLWDDVVELKDDVREPKEGIDGGLTSGPAFGGIRRGNDAIFRFMKTF